MNLSQEKIINILAGTISVPVKNVSAVVSLLDEGSTIPFISRYRKEMTGGLDEEKVEAIKNGYERLTDLEKRKQTVLTTIEEQGKLTDELRARIEDCYDPTALEDIYLPYKPKRRTKATVARELGLEPLAAILMRQDGSDPERAAARFVKGDVKDVAAALDGASDIIAEWVSENERARNSIRRLFANEAVVTSKVVKDKEQEGIKYSDYFGKSEPIRRIPSHRLLAILRGEREGFLRVSAQPEEDKALDMLDRIFIKRDSPSAGIIEDAISDGYKRLLKPSIENETISGAREKAEEEAIEVFARNLRQLLMAPPLGNKRIMGVDPGFRTGCKVVCLDANGRLLHNSNIYPHPPQSDVEKARRQVQDMVSKYDIEAIAVGDGTAGRETESFLSSIPFDRPVGIYMVNEDGASVYSASQSARDEFPDQDVTVRGSVSIARRLLDPLAELVKIDPKSIGVGQYQHDVDQAKLREKLKFVVESCVNRVGVNLNTASYQLLSYVSGLGESLSKNIVAYRSANGSFTDRKDLLKVPRLGAKAFEQCAGFLRIPGGKNPLDNTAVHPESYGIVGQMAKDAGLGIAEFIKSPEARKETDLTRYTTAETGLPTINDIMDELARPGRDPRGEIKAFSFDPNVKTIEDLRVGMILPGIVTNMTNFGAFVDIGIKQDGLVHISQIANRFIKDPADVLSLQQQVDVKVLDIDHARGRINLSITAAAV